MSSTVIMIIAVLAYIILSPFIGGLLDGIDRKLSARMQGRKGPKLLQPFYDVNKLFKKQFLTANKMQVFLVISYTFFIIVTGCLFFAGCDLLLCFFALSTAVMFFILAASSTHSPFSAIGSQREMMQMMSYEPMVLLTAVGFYLSCKSFKVSDIISQDLSAIIVLPGFFVGFVFIMIIKMRKSPFDLSASHHAHQEVVRGITSEMSGFEFGLTTIAEWYETVFLYAIIGLFIVNSNPISYLVAVVVELVVFFLIVLIDNTSARVKWQLMLKLSWLVTIIAGGLNFVLLEVFNYF